MQQSGLGTPMLDVLVRPRWRTLEGAEAVAFHELVIDVNTWLADGVTGKTAEIMDKAYAELIEPTLPVICMLPSGRSFPYGKPNEMQRNSAWMPLEDGLLTREQMVHIQ